jgi:spermidine synthase
MEARGADARRTEAAVPEARPAPPRGTRVLLAACFFISGGAALVYEVLWSRHLQLLFGSTTESVAVVLAVFMAGLGLGAHRIGRIADRARSPMALYGLLEIGVGIWALATEPLLAAARAAWLAGAAHLGATGPVATLLKLVLASAVLLPPATLMGGTLPALVRATAGVDAGIDAGIDEGKRADGARSQTALLYALNTLGAVLGTLAAGLFLVEALGLSLSMRLTAVTNLGVGALVFVRARRTRGHPMPANETPPVDRRAGGTLKLIASSAAGRYALGALALSGAVTMLYEVVFTRVLGLVFGVSSYAFTAVLAAFLVGLGLGALWAKRIGRGAPPSTGTIALAQIGLGLAGVLALAAIPLVPRLVLYLRQVPQLGFWEVLAAKSAIAAALLLPIALVAGLATPLALEALATAHAGERLGRVLGDAYMVNTAGTIGGSLLAGFLLVAKLGTQNSLRVGALASLVVGLAGALGRDRRLAGALAAVAGIVLAAQVPRWPDSTFLVSDSYAHPKVQPTRLALERLLASEPRERLYFAEGREATVAVLGSPEARTLLVNGHPDASDGDDMATQFLLGALPAAAHPRPEQVMVVGFGSGVTAAATLRLPEVRHVDVVELEPAVLGAAPLFHHVNRAVESDPRVRVVLADARSFTLAAADRYDLIVSEPSNPWRAGVAALFTAEYYRAASTALRPGGLFAQWVQLYGLTEGTLKMILRTLGSVFPELQVWYLDAGNVVVLGSAAPMPIDAARMEALFAGPFRDEARRHARIQLPGEIWARFLLDTAGARAFAEAGGDLAIHTDDEPLLEFEAARGLSDSDGRNPHRLIAAKLARYDRGPLPPLPPIAGERPAPAAPWLGMAQILLVAGRDAVRADDARAAIARAVAADPSRAVLARAADLLLALGDSAAAEPLVDRARAAPSSDASTGAEGGSVTALAEVTARLRAAQHREAEALVALEAAGAPEGRRGVDRLAYLVAVGRGDDALAQAERSLGEARLGAEVDPHEVSRIYDQLELLATGSIDPLRIAAVVERYPGEGFPTKPRAALLAGLYDRAGRAEDALARAETALGPSRLDPDLLTLELSLLLRLGRTDEAMAVEQRLRTLAPERLRPRLPRALLPMP